MNKRKHLTFLIASRKFSGYEVRYLKLAYYLFKNGYNVSVLVKKVALAKTNKIAVRKILDDSEFESRVYKIGIPYIDAFQKPASFLFRHLFGIDLFLLLCIKTLQEIKADAVYTNKALPFLKIIKDKLQILVVKDFTSPESAEQFYIKNHQDHIENADFLVFVSETVRDRFDKNIDKINTQSIKMPMLVTAPIPFFYPIEIGDNIQYENKENIMIFAHRLLARKNPVLFARLVKRMCVDPSFDTWKFCLFGSGEKEKEVKEMLNKEVSDGRVEVGYRENLISYLKKSKIFFSLIEPNSFPSQSVMEAMACGNAIVVLNTGQSDFFVDGNGLVLEKNEDLIYREIEKLARSSLKPACERSINLVHERLSPDEYLKYINEILYYANSDQAR